MNTPALFEPSKTKRFFGKGVSWVTSEAYCLPEESELFCLLWISCRQRRHQFHLHLPLVTVCLPLQLGYQCLEVSKERNKEKIFPGRWLKRRENAWKNTPSFQPAKRLPTHACLICHMVFGQPCPRNLFPNCSHYGTHFEKYWRTR